MNPGIRLDFPRGERIGIDEAVLSDCKTPIQLAALLDVVAERAGRILLTRLNPEAVAALPARHLAQLDYEPASRTAIYGPALKPRGAPLVAIITAGSGDTPIGREAARTLAYHGEECLEIQDVGVAGLWRLLEKLDQIAKLPVLIVAAGMDAALISVVGGLVGGAVIAVPTSVGYGVAAGGTTALNAALASCAPGITVVNIDNGYGAACAALRIINALRR